MKEPKDRLKSGEPAWLARQRRWRHNSFLGHVAMARQNMWVILTSDSTTQKAKKLSQEVYQKLVELEDALKVRVDSKPACIGCANGNDLPDGERCEMCGRTGSAR